MLRLLSSETITEGSGRREWSLQKAPPPPSCPAVLPAKGDVLAVVKAGACRVQRSSCERHGLSPSFKETAKGRWMAGGWGTPGAGPLWLGEAQALG